jgi:hypothetical protein
MMREDKNGQRINVGDKVRWKGKDWRVDTVSRATGEVRVYSLDGKTSWTLAEDTEVVS